MAAQREGMGGGGKFRVLQRIFAPPKTWWKCKTCISYSRYLCIENAFWMKTRFLLSVMILYRCRGSWIFHYFNQFHHFADNLAYFTGRFVAPGNSVTLCSPSSFGRLAPSPPAANFDKLIIAGNITSCNGKYFFQNTWPIKIFSK